MFQSSQQQNKGGKKNTDAQSNKQNGPYVNHIEFLNASLKAFDKQAPPAQMKAGEEEVQAKKTSDQAAQMQEEEELQAKMSNSSPIQAMVAEEEGKPTQKKAIQMQEEEEVQAKNGNNTVKNQQNIANTSTGTSTTMPEQVQAKMENSFGSDFSGVNIQQNSDQATNMGALAFTQGSNIHFAPGQYKPDSMSGQELLGHELTHVVQQKAGKVKGSQNKNGFNVNSSPSLENEADLNGKKAAQGQQADVAGVGSGVQRKEALPPDHAQGTIKTIGDKKVFITAIHSKAGEKYSGKEFDTLYSISKKTGISIEEIKRLNPGINPNELRQGMEIVLAPVSQNAMSYQDIYSFRPTQPMDMNDKFSLIEKNLEKNIKISDNQINDQKRDYDQNGGVHIYGNGGEYSPREKAKHIDGSINMKDVGGIFGIISDLGRNLSNKKYREHDAQRIKYAEHGDTIKDVMSGGFGLYKPLYADEVKDTTIDYDKTRIVSPYSSKRKNK